mmetsp:Transcript_2937/g.6358  ORF Transcript_2937/g.6358 Transcript_2937/m.6358 type:complete len:634 (-) Transcript_2937:139-2040(-)
MMLSKASSLGVFNSVSDKDGGDADEVIEEDDVLSPLPPSNLPSKRNLNRMRFSVLVSTEENNRSKDMNFYGPFAHIRKTLDYTYHSNYTKQRQVFQDSIIEEFLESVSLTDVNGDVCTTPTEPWVVFSAGAMGAGKGYTINELVTKGHFPLLAFVTIDPDAIRRRFPEFMLYVEHNPLVAGDLTHKEAGYVAEILTLAALQAGKNCLVDGSLRDHAWYQIYFQQLRDDFPNSQIAIIHVVAPREVVFQRAAERAKRTGRVVPRETLEGSLEQVPKSVKILSPLADFFCELNNPPDAEIEILTEGLDWDTFQVNWLQTCAYVPGTRKKPFGTRKAAKKATDATVRASVKRGLTRLESRSFSVKVSTAVNYGSKSSDFYGSYSHIRSNLDYSYHSNYTKERQWVQDAIIKDILSRALSADRKGNSSHTPNEPWLVFMAGAPNVGKSHTIRHLAAMGRFPLGCFVWVEVEEIRRQLPEFLLYVDQCPTKAEEMTRHEIATIREIAQLSALQAGRNCLVDATMKDKNWYQRHIQMLRKEFPHTRIAILHVVAPRETVFWRAEKRAAETGMVIPSGVIDTYLDTVPESVEALKPLVDYCVELSNNANADDIEIVGGNWESFESKWHQTCIHFPEGGNT